MSVQNTTKQSKNIYGLDSDLVFFRANKPANVLDSLTRDIDRQGSIQICVTVVLIFLKLFSMHRAEALMVCRILKACCTVSNPLCRGRRQLFSSLSSVFNGWFYNDLAVCQ